MDKPPALKLLASDYVPVSKEELQEHAFRCRHVELLDKGWILDPSSAGMQFARFFWKQTSSGSKQQQAPGVLLSYESPTKDAARTVTPPLNSAGAGSEAHGTGTIAVSSHGPKFFRLDGQDEYSADKFSLMEGGTSLVRQEASDPFRSRAVLMVNEPAVLLAQGQYFEVQIMSVFDTPGRPDRPRDAAPRRRTEGLALGFTTSRPDSLKDTSGQPASDRTLEDVPNSWSLAMTGALYRSTGSTGRQPVMSPRGERVRELPSWHRKIPVPQSARGVKWPLSENDPKATIGSRLRWSAAVGAGDRVGLLATTFGGIVLFVNGCRELMVPDAGVKVDEQLYPLVEVYNHVRAVRLTVGALPPS